MKVASRARAHAREQMLTHLHLFRGSVGVMLTTVITLATGWLFWVVAAHHWSASVIGVASSLIAAMSLVSLVAAQPVGTTLLTRLPLSQHRIQLFRAAVILSAMIALACSLPTLTLLPGNLGEVRTPGIAVLFVVGSVATSIGIILDSSALAVRRPGLMLQRNGVFGVGKLLVLGAVALAAVAVSGPFAVMGAWVTVSCGACMWAARSWTRGEARRPATKPSGASATNLDADGESGWRVLRRGFGAQVLGVLGGSLPPQVLPILVVTRLGSVVTGWFSIAWLVGGLCFMISPSVCQALLAEGSFSPDRLREKTVAAMALSSGLLVVPVLVCVFAGRTVLDLFGSAYGSHGGTLLAILAVSSLPDMVTNIAVSRFRVQQRLWAAALVNVTIAVVAVAGAWWTLPSLGIVSPAWMWLLAQCAGCLVLVGIAVSSKARERAMSPTSPRPEVA